MAMDGNRDSGEGAAGLSAASRLLVAVGALEGAAGVALAAVAAHAVRSEALGNAATLLMAHGGVVAALALLAGLLGRRGWMLRLPVAVIALGAGLFGTAVAVRVLAAPDALGGVAPIGGTLTILGWLGLLIPALFAGRR